MDSSGAFIIIMWILFSFVVGGWNRGRGNSFLVGFLISLVFSPLVGLIFVALTSTDKKAIEKRAVKSGEMKKCPHCAEIIKAEAMKCRFCGSNLSKPESDLTMEKILSQAEKRK